MADGDRFSGSKMPIAVLLQKPSSSIGVTHRGYTQFIIYILTRGGCSKQ